MWKMYILILKFCGDLITYVKKVSCVQCNIFVHLCKILRFRRNLDFYISIYWNVKFASSHVNYTHAKILTYKKIMLNWTFSQLTFFLHMWKQNMAHRIPQICLFRCLFWHVNKNFQIWNWHFPFNDIDSSAISFFPHMWIKSSHA